MKDNYAAIMSTVAVVLALTSAGAVASGVVVTTKTIKNGTVKSIDLQNGGVKSADLKNESVGSADIGSDAVASSDIANDAVGSSDIAPGAVESAALSLPAPVQCQVTGETKIHPTMAFAKVADVCTYTKGTAESILEVDWTGSVEGHNRGEISGCVFQVRINGSASAPGAGVVFGAGLSPVSVSALFAGLPAGPLTIEIWARLAAYEPAMGGDSDACTVGPVAASTAQTITVGEQVI
ncbi:MAG TPA: hypothetical protein VEW07_11440 [Solirubrobacterales bacterium]|nr:hypothetical protein [Solirubrobacterales bacterium]